MFRVPPDALAFISIKAKTKWRGLINVSGFHVDPGYEGRLIFAVFNAGPVSVHLRQGQPLNICIPFASLDRPTKVIRKQPLQEHIPADLITGISGELQSFAGISEKVKTVEKNLTDRINAIEREQIYYRIVAGLFLIVFGAMITAFIKDGGFSHKTLANETTTNAAAPTLAGPPINGHLQAIGNPNH